MKCFNCLSRFVRKSKISDEDIITEDYVMATWDDIKMYGYSIRDLGLKTCPFNASHKVKASKYSKHVMQCERKFPKTGSFIRGSTSRLNSTSLLSIDSFYGSQSDANERQDIIINELMKSMKELNTDDPWPSEAPEPVASTSDRSQSPDSAIGLTTTVSINDDNTEREVETHPSPQTSGLTDTSAPTADNSGHNEEPIEPSSETRSVEPNVVSIVPQQTTTHESTNHNNVDNGSGDSDPEWTSTGKTFSIYEGLDNFDDLTDDQIMEMANSFIDVVVLAKMTKTQKKQLNEKLLELRRAEKEQKKKAFNELVTFKDVWDPQLKDIPEEIRKPRIDIRELFNLNKKQNKRIDTLMSATPISPDPKECPPNPFPNETLPDTEAQPLNLSLKNSEPSVPCCSKSAPIQIPEKHEVTTSCHNCWEPLALNEENIKRMTVFCAQCSGIKFGGYFECHSCKLYGYFANSQISQHLTKHFPQNN